MEKIVQQSHNIMYINKLNYSFQENSILSIFPIREKHKAMRLSFWYNLFAKQVWRLRILKDYCIL